MKNKIKILIVEDEGIIVMLLLNKLKKAGYTNCKAVPTAEEAIELAKIFQPSLILMDINLAGEMDGIEAAKKINDHKKIPIIFTTGYSKEEICKRTDEINPLDIVYKPIDIKYIIEIIEEKINI